MKSALPFIAVIFYQCIKIVHFSTVYISIGLFPLFKPSVKGFCESLALNIPALTATYSCGKTPF